MQRGGTVRIGLLFSSSGPYATVSRAMLNGALLAIEEVNACGTCPFRLEATVTDPAGCNLDYAAAARRMLAEERIAHVIGCYTSSSRKDVVPLFEKHEALLWYPSHYEGFESSDSVVYTGAAPNQHIVPLIEHLLRNAGEVVYCVGSNYIWAWENNKILREAVSISGGRVLAERYFSVGETEFDTVIGQILSARPRFVFNTLIGTSAYAFLRAFRAAARARGVDQPRTIPVASCSLSEPELVEIGPEACDGHISSSVYFASIDTPANRAFVAAYSSRFPQAGPTSADAESSYIAGRMLALAFERAGSAETAAVRTALPGLALHAPQGRVQIDGDNRHSHLTPRIGVSTRDAGFCIVHEAPGPVKPDPYLVWHEFGGRGSALRGNPGALRGSERPPRLRLIQ